MLKILVMGVGRGGWGGSDLLGYNFLLECSRLKFTYKVCFQRLRNIAFFKDG